MTRKGLFADRHERLVQQADAGDTSAQKRVRYNDRQRTRRQAQREKANSGDAEARQELEHQKKRKTECMKRRRAAEREKREAGDQEAIERHEKAQEREKVRRQRRAVEKHFKEARPAAQSLPARETIFPATATNQQQQRGDQYHEEEEEDVTHPSTHRLHSRPAGIQTNSASFDESDGQGIQAAAENDTAVEEQDSIAGRKGGEPQDTVMAEDMLPRGFNWAAQQNEQHIGGLPLTTPSHQSNPSAHQPSAAQGEQSRRMKVETVPKIPTVDLTADAEEDEDSERELQLEIEMAEHARTAEEHARTAQEHARKVAELRMRLLKRRRL